MAWERETVGAVGYLLTSEDQQVQMAMRVQEDIGNKQYYSTISTALRVLRNYSLHAEKQDGATTTQTRA